MKRSILAPVYVMVMAMASPLLAEPLASAPPASLIDYPAFAQLTGEVAGYRVTRLVGLARFREMASEGDTLILDARSSTAFIGGHIRGAVNLPFTDFTAGSLARVIGDPNRRILIYCNNNFSNDVEPVRTKSARLALNIQTFINLYGYGYRNVYELADTVDINDPSVGWVSSGA